MHTGIEKGCRDRGTITRLSAGLRFVLRAMLALLPALLPAQNGGPPVYEPVDPFLAAPATGALYEIPVVILRYLPTTDGRTGDVAYDPDYYSLNPLQLSAIKQRIDLIDRQVKFMLEEGSRFRGYKDPAARPALGYRVVDYITVYEPTPPGRLITLASGKQVHQIDYHQMFNRFNARRYVEELGVKEFWIWMSGHDFSFPSYNPSVNRPGTGRTAWESNMSSALTGDVSNSDRDNSDLPVYRSTYVVYTQNYRRTAAEAVHNRGHQLEAILSHVARRQDGSDNLFWNRFVGREASGRFTTGRAGWTHMPPNTTRDYDYTNTTPVASDIEDWTPAKTGALKNVNMQTWTSLRYPWPNNIATEQPDAWWYIYWMQSMPGIGNRIPHSNSRVMSDWWQFTADWDAAHRARTGLHAAAGIVLVSPGDQAIPAEGGSGTVSVQAPDAWIATSNARWIQIEGVTNTSAAYRVLANPAVEPRTATIAISGAGFRVTQAGRACTIRLAPDRTAIAAAGGEASVNVTIAPSDCSWTARSDASWLTIGPRAANTGEAKLLVTAAANPAQTPRTARLIIGDQTLSFTQAAAANPVQIASVEHGASFRNAICFNCWISIKGTGLSTASRSWTAADFRGARLPTELSGVRVTIDGVPAYVSYISPVQINVLTPSSLPSAGGRASVEVSTPQGRSSPFAVPINPIAAEFFTVEAAGKLLAAAVHADGFMVAPEGAYGPAVASRPARPGDTVLLFGSGFGGTLPALIEGESPAQPSVLSSVVSLAIGGIPATISWAGLVSPGLYQLNVIVPPASGPDAALEVSVSGTVSLGRPRLAIAP